MLAVVVAILLFESTVDLPPESDVFMFPDETMVRGAREFSVAYRNHVELRRWCDLRNWSYWNQISEDIARHSYAWDLLLSAQGKLYMSELDDEGELPVPDDDGEYMSVSPLHKRRALAQLKKLLGPEAYYSGRMPCAVPCRAYSFVN